MLKLDVSAPGIRMMGWKGVQVYHLQIVNGRSTRRFVLYFLSWSSGKTLSAPLVHQQTS